MDAHAGKANQFELQSFDLVSSNLHALAHLTKQASDRTAYASSVHPVIAWHTLAETLCGSGACEKYGHILGSERYSRRMTGTEVGGMAPTSVMISVTYSHGMAS